MAEPGRGDPCCEERAFEPDTAWAARSSPPPRLVRPSSGRYGDLLDPAMGTIGCPGGHHILGCLREATRNPWPIWSGDFPEPMVRFELTACRLRGGCSATELHRHTRHTSPDDAVER